MVDNLKTFYNGKKVFLTGHTGFKGSWLLTWLSELGPIVKGYALEPEYENSLFQVIQHKIPFENCIQDIRNKSQLKNEILSFQPDIIFHLAAQPLVRKSYQIPTETFEVNAIGTANLLEATIELEKKCTIVIITTDKVYENLEQNYHYKESDRLGGYDPYSASKAATEIVVSSFRNSFFNRTNYQLHQKAIVVARAGNVIGGGDFSTDRIIPDIVNAIENDKTIEVRNPKAIRPWQHVLEPLMGYLQLAFLADINYELVGDAYNFGPLANDHIPVSQLVDTAIKVYGKGTWKDVSNPNQLHEAGLLMLAIDKAIKELNWKPKLNSQQAIEWTINWYKEKENKFEFTKNQIRAYQDL